MESQIADKLYSLLDSMEESRIASDTEDREYWREEAINHSVELTKLLKSGLAIPSIGEVAEEFVEKITD